VALTDSLVKSSNAQSFGGRVESGSRFMTFYGELYVRFPSKSVQTTLAPQRNIAMCHNRP
jgi:hypothetical protein